MNKWFDIVTYSILTIGAIIVGYDIYLYVAGRPTISEVTWVYSLKGFFPTAFFGVLMGHFFLPFGFSKTYKKFIPPAAWLYLIACLLIDILTDVMIPRWGVPVLFALNFLIGGLLWPMRRDD